MILRIFTILLFFTLLFDTEISAQSINTVRKQKAAAEKEISYLNKLLENAAKDKSVSTRNLKILQEKIIQSERLLKSLNQEVKYFQNEINSNEKRITELQVEKNNMLDLYAKLVYGTWKKRNKTDKLMFIFSSADFNQAYNRFKYFQQIQEYSNRQFDLIRQINDSLNFKNLNLDSLMTQKSIVLNTINTKNKDFESQKTRESREISNLQKKEKDLETKLKNEEHRRRKLNEELNKLIAIQIKKSGSNSSTKFKLTPEQKLVSADFAKNKGKLPWPVTEGFVSKKYGLNTDLIHKNVKHFNDGIDIMTSKNADVYAVFKGVVGKIWHEPYLNYVVMIRHGNYITVYQNLKSVSVKEKDIINTKDIIGKIENTKDDGSVLHFQLWKVMEKQNPSYWLAK